MSNLVEVKVPDIGDFKDIPIIEVMVKPGDSVNAEDPDRKSTRLNSSHSQQSRMPSSA